MKKINKCDYCEKEATYSCGAVLRTETIPIQTCDKHFPMGYTNQQSLLEKERLDDLDNNKYRVLRKPLPTNLEDKRSNFSGVQEILKGRKVK